MSQNRIVGMQAPYIVVKGTLNPKYRQRVVCLRHTFRLAGDLR